MSRGEILHDRINTVSERHEVTAERDIFRRKRDPHIRSLQGAASGVTILWVVAEDRQIGHIASRRKPRRNRIDQPQGSFSGHPVHVGGTGVFQGGLPPENIDGVIGHPVAKQDQMLHLRLSSSILISIVLSMTISSRSISSIALRTSSSRALYVVITTGTGPPCFLPFWMTVAILMSFAPRIPEIRERTPGRS